MKNHRVLAVCLTLIGIGTLATSAIAGQSFNGTKLSLVTTNGVWANAYNGNGKNLNGSSLGGDGLKLEGAALKGTRR